MRRLALMLAWVVALAGPPGMASSGTTVDYSDLWWNAAESGWGAHVTLQDDVVFMVLYVYDESRQPRFFVAPEMRRSSGSTTIHEGTLYRTTGPAFSAAFDPSQVGVTAVGSARLEFANPLEARLEYTVGGMRVQKTLTRQTWRARDLAGDYMGGLFATATVSSCPLGLPSIAYAGVIRVTQDGEAVAIDMNVAPGFAENGTCHLSGRLEQQGSLASIRGSYTCAFSNENTTSGTFELAEVESGPHGFGGRYSAVEGGTCRHAGYLGGTRRSRSAARPPEPDPEN
jgi:hypothetical protein